jgi:hypothetical protein
MLNALHWPHKIESGKSILPKKMNKCCRSTNLQCLQALTSDMCKLIEKMMFNWRMSWLFVANGYISEEQQQN